MKTEKDLKELLFRIDHKGYKAYKDTRGKYQFKGYILSIDHVQGDPFAAPSRVSIWIDGKEASFPKEYYDLPCKRIALQDILLRKFAGKISEKSFQAKGSGKSGILHVTRPGQEIFDRTACQINSSNGTLTVRMEIGFPANGRSINAGELIKILYTLLPECIEQTLFFKAYEKSEKGVQLLEKAVCLAQDQQYLREHLEEQQLVAFIADGSVLPRESGVSSRPMKKAVAFYSPESMRVEFVLPNHGKISGMGIRQGITLIVGGGYHGKSTLLKALEQGIYNHISGDGREYVVTDGSAVKLRAEDGRCIHDTDISLFIHNLPNEKDTTCFSTEDASGSTSQAANVIEAIKSESRVFLIDEDTSATNFMVRDELMQSVVNREMEPIIPYIDRIRSLYEKRGISTILVAGSSGSYFLKADCVIQMNRYKPEEITKFARKKAEQFYGNGYAEEIELADIAPSLPVPLDCAWKKRERNKIKIRGKEEITFNYDTVDLRYVEQIVDVEQVNAIAQMIRYAKNELIRGDLTVEEIVEKLMRTLLRDGFNKICENNVSGNLAVPRKQEVAAAIYRYRRQK